MNPRQSALFAALVGVAQREADEQRARDDAPMDFRIVTRPEPGPVIYHERSRNISGVPAGFSRAKRRAKNKAARKARKVNRKKGAGRG